MKTNHWLKIAGLFLTLLYATEIGSAQTNDSIISLEADIAQLSLLPASDVPSIGTFWLVTGSNGVIAPFPGAPPCIGSDNTYAMPNGAFLVDGTDGESGVGGEQLLAQMNAVSNLIVTAQALATTTTSQTMGIRAMDDSGPAFPGGGDGGSGTNDGSSGIIGNAVDYGTNLWIAQWSMASNLVTGIASNTIEDVQYEILTNSDLATTNWGHSGVFISGSETTNWTTLPSLVVNATNNMFFRLLSWQSSDGSGLPDWWEEQYFGTNNIDPYADPAGDGWSNYQKFQNGWDPNLFYTPPAPQGVTVAYNVTNNMATISWLPSPGNVTNYTVTDSMGESFTVSPSTTSYQISVTASPVANYDPTINETFQVEGDYAGGNSTPSAPTPLEANSLSASIVPGPSNAVYVAISGVPANAVSLNWILYYNDYNGIAQQTTNVISLSALTNGLFTLPSSWLPASSLIYGSGSSFSLQSRNHDGSLSAAVIVPNPFPNLLGTEWNLTFFDGREQLKQNLIFQFRIANAVTPFSLAIYTIGDPGPDYFYQYQTTAISPSGYVYASFHDINNYNGIYGTGRDDVGLNVYRPFEDNYFYRNFVYGGANFFL